jgi:large subunit ribosomal protein L10
MALNLSQKQNVVAEVAEVAAKAHSLIAAEYIGTTVSQMTAMRKQARETGVFLKVVKNSLAARAVTGTDYECAKDSMVGPLLYAFSTEEPGAAGRLIKAKPATAKGQFLQKISVSSTMGPGVAVDQASLTLK